MESTTYNAQFRKKRKRYRREDTRNSTQFSEFLISDETKGDNRRYYTGVFDGSCVKVVHSGDIHDLYNMGSFGKGILSRSRPVYVTSQITIPPPSRELHPLKLMHRNKYIKHLNWRNQHDAKGEYVEIPDLPETTDLAENDGNENTAEQAMDTENQDNSAEKYCLDINEGDKNVQNMDSDAKCDNEEMNWDNMDADDDFWSVDTKCGTGYDKLIERDKNNKSREASDFSGDVQTVSESRDHCDLHDNSEKCSCKFESLEEASENIIRVDIQTTLRERLKSDADNFSDTKCDNLTSREKDTVKKHELKYDDGKSYNIPQQKQSGNSNVGSLGENLNAKRIITNSVLSETVHKKPKIDQSGVVSLNQDDNRIEDHETNKKFSLNKDIQLDENMTELKKYEENVNTDIDATVTICLDSLCGEHEMDGDVLVVPDICDERVAIARGSKPLWTPVIKHDPYPMMEYMVLSLEEAFFLTYALGCLIVKDENHALLDVCSMWRQFTRAKKSFFPLYIAYHHFRCKGWVPKCGLKFGAHFLLYKDGPDSHHASFSVIVQSVDETTLLPSSSNIDLDLSWIGLQGLNRISENVAKEVLMCHVIGPDINTVTTDSPECLKLYCVQEVLVKRWISSQEREGPS